MPGVILELVPVKAVRHYANAPIIYSHSLIVSGQYHCRNYTDLKRKDMFILFQNYINSVKNNADPDHLAAYEAN